MSLTTDVQTDLDSLTDIASIVSQNILLFRLKYVEEYYVNISYSIFHVFCRCDEIVQTIFFM